MSIREITTQPFSDQKSGTAGLRKKVTVFQQPHYLENFLQSIFDLEPALRDATLVIGGDGRFYNRTAIQTAIAMAAANGVQRVIVGQGGLMSTPAASNLIRVRNAAGGFLFTASHNPAGPDGDFGIKFNIAGGGQANESLTNALYEHSRTISRYRIAEVAPVDLDTIGTHTIAGCAVEVVDPVADYAALMQKLFDFDRIRAWLAQGNRIAYDGMHAVTGPYAQRILVDMLGAPADAVMNAVPLEDFGGGHPDPNLIYAHHLYTLAMSAESPALIGASDGDGDRNMILGRGLFISPGDSLAMLAAHLHLLPGYPGGPVGVARSMPTCRAVDQVASALNIPCFETPTGWKFFCNLLDAGKLTLCGEESFGTSSVHAREKDGLWAFLAWANVLAATGLSVQQLAQQHWAKFGRHYYVRHDYEELPTAVAESLMNGVRSKLAGWIGQQFGDLTVTLADDFRYEDPIDHSIATKQGLRIVFGDQARIVLRLSGTGTSGATLRLYLEHYLPNTANSEQFLQASQDILAPLATLANQLAEISAITGRDAPDVVT